MAPVYNLTVATEHEYYANGVRVKNCDALRYLVVGIARLHGDDAAVVDREVELPPPGIPDVPGLYELDGPGWAKMHDPRFWGGN